MSNWTPEEIDQLFQDGSKKYDFEYNEAAWNKMEVLLDDRDRRKKRFLWWFIGGLLSVLLIGGIYFFGPTHQEKQVSKKTTTITLKETKSLSTNDNFEKTVIKEHLTKITTAAAGSNSAKTLTKPSIQKENASFNNTVIQTIQPKIKHVISADQTNQTAITTVNPKTVLPTPTANQLASEVTLTGQQLANLSPDSIAKESRQNLAQTTTLPLVGKKSGMPVMVNALPTLSNTIALFDEPILLDTSFLKQVETITNNQKKVTDNHFVIGLLLGRELSFSDVGVCDRNWKAGLSLAYRFSDKHSLKIEGSYIEKDYAASGDKYIAPQGFWENGISPQTTIGTCNIIEASITESYFFKGHSAKGFYVEAGLSSYFLLSERYDYNYEIINQNQRAGWRTDNTSQHLFGIGEIAIGYNLPFSNNASLQIAPYAQIPFTGIGHGQVKFFSTGVQLRYNFHLK